MSDSQETSQNIQFKVQMGTLPDGFCPSNAQELAYAIAARLLVSPENNFSSFVTGCVMPSSNVGPWLKCGNAWWIWDPNLGTYVPISNFIGSGMQAFEVDGVFTVPNDIYKLTVECWGAGGGGSGSAGGGSSGAGGGGGGYGKQIFAVTPGDTIAYMVGVGGVAGSGGSGPGGDGTATTFKTLSAAGGIGGLIALAGVGGAYSGAIVGINGGAGCSTVSNSDQAAPGGDAGGGGGAGGAGGANSAQSVLDGVVPGGGGAGENAGGPATMGGAGASGRILISY